MLTTFKSLASSQANRLATWLRQPAQRAGKSIRHVTCALLVFSGALFGSAQAKDYIVEVILFENTSRPNVTEPHAYEAPKKPRTQAQAWVLDTKLLSDQVEKIRNSSDYDLKYHFAWGQEALPYSRSATYTVVEREAQGYIKVYAENLLFANIDLDYKGFRMVEKRRLKLNEKHYFDHPQFGILMQVSRLPRSASSNNSIDGSSE